jgi:hypothetical protein
MRAARALLEVVSHEPVELKHGPAEDLQNLSGSRNDGT